MCIRDRATTCAVVAQRNTFCRLPFDGTYAVMLFTLRVSLPVAEREKLCPAAVEDTVIVSVSVLLPVYPVTLAPAGSPDVLSVYPLLMLVSLTAVCPEKPPPDWVRVTEDGLNAVSYTHLAAAPSRKYPPSPCQAG